MKTERDYSIWKVIASAAAGTMIEWYDFYIFGSLAAIMSGLFFPKENPTAGFLLTLATFATGFAVRPFGAIFFGRIGDLIGRKYAFLVTLLIMGGATFVIGLLPTYEQIGIFAPMILVLLRLLQGLALGGEYGGAAIYVAEHVPDNKRGFYTSFIQTTATLGLFVSLGVILIVRTNMSEADFKTWGWRIPFLLSILLVLMSLYIRMRLKESPLFTQLKNAGKTSTAPLRDSLGSGRNWRVILLVLFGAAAGQAVVWYTGQFYALFFLQNVLKVDFIKANIIVAIALALGTPFFIVFGALSDRIGRKKVMMAGNLIAALSYYPIYQAMKAASEPLQPVLMTLLVFVQVIFVTMVYGPIAAFLVEAFPAKIRYTSLSLPYHIGNGWFGGFTPLIATAVVARTGHIYAGLWYPISIALLTFVVGTIFLRESKDVKIWDEVGPA
ncbi:MAG TPA: MFS transporter [Thermoanaerobaculia bacterium]|jgi:MFS family permease|nr:MFS transporter [Thermoanaerobaculia bacterium]